MKPSFSIGGRPVGKGAPVFLVAEMSANHLQDYRRALAILRAAREAGADAIKLQTYTADTLTIDSDGPLFRISGGSPWDGMTLHQLYRQASTPWEWHAGLAKEAEKLGLLCFSSPFDHTAVDFLAGLDMPAYKVASDEITDLPLIRKIARLHRPILFATGCARLEDLERALEVCRQEKNEEVMLLKCVSSYPTPYEDIHLRTLPTLARTFGCAVGLSDHSLGTQVAVAAVALGASLVEKHLTLRRSDGGPDSAFSMEPEEFAQMAEQIRAVEKALGDPEYRLTAAQERERETGARSLFVVADMREGEVFTPENVRSIRPGQGLPPMYYESILGKSAAKPIRKGTPLSWNLVR